MADLVLTPAEIRLLEGLRLTPRRSFHGRVRGERLTQKKGVSIDFADTRDYVEGDDLRHLDWNVFARLGQAVVKTYREEEDLAVYLMLDTSSSMGFGEPTKLDHARRLACALGLVGLAGGDAVTGWALGSQRIEQRPWRGRASYPKLARWASSLRAEGQAGLASSLRDFARSPSRAGVAILLSDGLDPDLPTALRAVAARGHEILLVNTLSPLDIDPDLEGDLRLLDSESGAAVEITANSPTLAAYRKNFQRHADAVQEALTSRGGRAQTSLVGQTVGQALRDSWKREGWVA